MGPVIRSMEKHDMSLSQCKQIRERFLANSRQHFLVSDIKDNVPCSRAGRTSQFSRASEATLRQGKIED